MEQRQLQKKRQVSQLYKYFLKILSSQEVTHSGKIDKLDNHIKIFSFSGGIYFIKNRTSMCIFSNGAFSISHWTSFRQNISVVPKLIPCIIIPTLDTVSIETISSEKKVDEKAELFNLLFEKSKIENKYYFILDEVKDERAMEIPPYEIINKSINIHSALVFSNSFYLFYSILVAKDIKKTNKKKVDIKRVVYFKKTDPKIFNSKCTGTYTIKKYIPRQNGRVLLTNRQGDELFTNLKYLKNVRNIIKKKNNTIEAPFPFSIP